ncbi:MAG: TetR/AcrR family transcriptional regulator, partial [Anaerolineae bacterium]|nr:TetR/AcrR family transcriptional regulator [Anaerolineae bacterium]
REQMYGVARWLASQPPMDMTRLSESDMHALDVEIAKELIETAYNSLRIPIRKALQHAQEKGLIQVQDPDLAVMGLVSMIQSIHSIPAPYIGNQREQLALQLVDMLLDGWLIRA